MIVTWLPLLIVVSVTVSYIVLMGVITYGLLRIFRINRTPFYVYSPFALPKVSVIIPSRNESQNILNCLDDLLVQDYSLDLLEIIVSDDFSEDKTVSLVQAFIRQHPGLPVSVIACKGFPPDESGKKNALTRAISMASGDVILTTDADTHHGPSWISAMAKAFQDGQVHMVLGPVAFYHEQNFLQKIQSLEFMGLMGTTAGAVHLRIPLMCNGANLAYRRTAFFSVGGFEGNMQFASGDDVFMMSRIHQMFGSKSIGFTLDSRAVVYTEAEFSLPAFIRQRLRWVSKSKGYKGKVLIFVSLLTWLTHFFLLSGILIGFFHPFILIVSMGLWIMKILAEYPVVWLMARFFNKKAWLEYYFPAQLFQLVYVVLIGIAGNIFSYTWKGRKVKK